MQDWRSWETGRKTIYEGTEFDGSFHFEGVITEVHEDHLICEAEGMHLWVDDDTAESAYLCVHYDATWPCYIRQVTVRYTQQKQRSESR